MSVERTEGYYPDSSLEKDPVLEALDRLDASSVGYYRACGIYALWPTDKRIGAIHDSIETQFTAFVDLLDSVRHDATAEEIGDMGTNLIIAKSSERAEALNKIASRELIKSLQPGAITLDFDPSKNYESEDPKQVLIDECVTRYDDRISQDTSEFFIYVSNSEAGQRIERLHEIKDQAIGMGKEAGKIALGTTLGIIAAKFIARKK